MKITFSSRQTFNFVQNWVSPFQLLPLGNRLFRGFKLIIIEEIFSSTIMSLLHIFDDEDGDVGGQMKSDDLRTMRAVHVTYIHSRPRNCTPITRITRVLREYYVRKANYAQLGESCAHLRVTYLINIHKQ